MPGNPGASLSGLTVCDEDLALSTAHAGCIQPVDTYPTVFVDETYGTDPDQTWRVFTPDLPCPIAALRPALIYIPGGAFLGADPTDAFTQDLAEDWASQGYAVFAVDYTTNDDTAPVGAIIGTAGQNIATTIGPWDEAPAVEYARRGFEDVLTAVDYLKANATTYCVDPNRIIIGGASAGGMLAMAAAYGHDKFGIPQREFAGAFSLIGGMNLADADLDIVNGPAAQVVYNLTDPIAPRQFNDELVVGLELAGIPVDVITEDSGQHAVVPPNWGWPTTHAWAKQLVDCCVQPGDPNLGNERLAFPPVPPEGQALVGTSAKARVWVDGLPDGDDTTAGRVVAFQDVNAVHGVTLDTAHFYELMDGPVFRQEHIDVHNLQMIPFLALKPRDASLPVSAEVDANGNITWRAVADGFMDSFLIPELETIRDSGIPILLNVAHEPNNIEPPQYWDAGPGYMAEDYADMIKHVVLLARSVGATNILHVWATATAFGVGNNTAQADRAYPLDDLGGDTIVDYVGFTMYNTASEANWDNNTAYNSYEDILANAYAWSVTNHPAKPILIGEVQTLVDYAAPEPLLELHHHQRPGHVAHALGTPCIDKIEDVPVVDPTRAGNWWRAVIPVTQVGGSRSQVRAITKYDSDINKPWSDRYVDNATNGNAYSDRAQGFTDVHNALSPTP